MVIVVVVCTPPAAAKAAAANTGAFVPGASSNPIRPIEKHTREMKRAIRKINRLKSLNCTRVGVVQE